MRIKKILSIVFILMLFLSVLPTTTLSSYNVVVGTVIQYDNINQNWDLTLEENHSSGTGFKYLDENYPNGTILDIQVTEVLSEFVTYNMTVEAINVTGTNTNFASMFGLIILLVYPIFLADSLYPWNQTKFDLGLALWNIYFIDHSEFYDFFSDFNNDTFIEETFDDPAYIIDRADGYYKIEGTIASFNWLFDCTYIGSTGENSLTGNYTYQIIYDTATSIVQGFEMYCNYSGLFDGNQTEMFLYNQIEISDFDLPEFYYEVDIINKPVEPTPTPTPTPSTTTTQEGSVFLGPIITISFFSFWIIIRRKIK